MGVPNDGWFLLGKIPSRNGWELGVALFQETSIWEKWGKIWEFCSDWKSYGKIKENWGNVGWWFSSKICRWAICGECRRKYGNVDRDLSHLIHRRSGFRQAKWWFFGMANMCLINESRFYGDVLSDVVGYESTQYDVVFVWLKSRYTTSTADSIWTLLRKHWIWLSYRCEKKGVGMW